MPSGADAAPARLLLLPGLMCDAAIWASQVATLGPCVASCTVADYGDADRIDDMARRALAQAPDGPLSVAGHSMGGRVALEIARLAPDRLARLALLDTGFRPLAAGEAGERERAGRQQLLDLARREGVRAMAERWVQGMVHPARLGSELVSRIVEMFGRRSADDFERQIQALLARPDAGPVLPTLRCPTLVLCGREDSWAPVAQHQALQQGIPGSVLAVIDDCGHMSPMEQPLAVSDALASWLNGVSGA